MEKIKKFEEKFYGRIKARPLTSLQENLLENLLPEILLKNAENLPKNKKIFLEIGFGNGEHTAKIALQNKNSVYIGAEPFINGVASLLCKIKEENIDNIRIYNDDVRSLIKEIPDESIDGVFLLFPDPWPKRRHFERRFVIEKNIKEIYRILNPNGFWRIATDHEEYAKWILDMFDKPKISEMFSKQIYSKSNRPEEPVWPKTKYERKSNENSDVLFAIYTKK